MGMSQVVLQLKKVLADAGVTTGSTQDDVLIAATVYIATISKPEKEGWDAPPPMQVDAHSSGLQFDTPPAKPKRTKKKVTK